MDFYLQRLQTDATLQPFVVIMEGSRWNPGQVFVITERQAFQYPTVTKGVDYVFKLLYVLDLDYQPYCAGVWQFLQNVVYELHDDIPISSRVRDFRAFMHAQDIEN